MDAVMARPADSEEESSIVEARFKSPPAVMDVARRRVDADLAARMRNEILLTDLGVKLVVLLSLLADAPHWAMGL